MITIEEIIKNYGGKDGFIERQINWKLSHRTLHARDAVYDEVIDALSDAVREKRIKSVHGDASIRSYIWTTTRNKINDYYRQIERDKKKLLKEKIKAQQVRPEDDQYDSLYKEGIHIKNTAMLSEYEIRRVLMRIDLDKKLKTDGIEIAIPLIQGDKRKEIAESLDLDIGQAKGRIERVRKKLKDPSVEDSLKKIIKRQKRKPNLKFISDSTEVG